MLDHWLAAACRSELDQQARRAGTYGSRSDVEHALKLRRGHAAGWRWIRGLRRPSRTRELQSTADNRESAARELQSTADTRESAARELEWTARTGESTAVVELGR